MKKGEYLQCKFYPLEDAVHQLIYRKCERERLIKQERAKEIVREKEREREREDVMKKTGIENPYVRSGYTFVRETNVLTTEPFALH